jgi:hypothetical protein
MIAVARARPLSISGISGTLYPVDEPSYSELMLRVAAKLPAATGRIGDYLADVIALEAAGAKAFRDVASAVAAHISVQSFRQLPVINVR